MSPLRRPWNRRDRDGDSDVHTLIGAYALDALDDLDRARVERHLAGCESCAAEAAELRAATVRLADTAAQAPPPDLRTRVLAAAARTPQYGPPDPHLAGTGDRASSRPPAGHGPVRHGSAGRWPRRLAAAAVVAVLVVGAGVVGYAVQQHRVDQVRRQATAAQQRDAAQRARLDGLLAAPDATVLSRTMPDGTHIRMIVSAARDQAAVYLTDLAPAPSGRTYQLWLMSGAAATPEGVLPVGSGSYTTLLAGLHGKDSFGISIEPPHGSPAPTTVYTVLPLT